MNATKWSLRESKGEEEGPQSFRTSPLDLSSTTVGDTCIIPCHHTVLWLLWSLKKKRRWGKMQGGVGIRQGKDHPSLWDRGLLLSVGKGRSILHCPAGPAQQLQQGSATCTRALCPQQALWAPLLVLMLQNHINMIEQYLCSQEVGQIMFKTMELLSACATQWDSRAHAVRVCVCLSGHKHTSRKQTDYPKDAVAPMPD